MTIVPYVLEVGSQEVILTPDARHEFTATTEQVALGYGVTPENIRKHKETKAEELLEGKHWVVSITHTPGGQQKVTLWTKRGIVRLGFFIRSARARLFRDMAEDLVIGAMTANVAAQSGPALITARGVAAGMGCSRTSAQNRIAAARIKPTAHYLDDLCKNAGYLYPLDAVQARWPDATFEPYAGKVLAGLGPVARHVAVSRTGKSTKHLAPQPAALPLRDMDVDTLARVIAVAVKAALA